MDWSVIIKIVEYGICNELGERRRIFKQDIRRYNIVSLSITSDGKLLGPTVKILKRSDIENKSKGNTTLGLLSPTLVESTNIKNLYHGSKSGIQMPIKPNFSSKKGDFGVGFYLGDNKNQANNIVRKFSTAKLYRMRLDLSGLTLFDLSSKWELWSMYILYSRELTTMGEFPHRLIKQMKLVDSSDVVFGAIADDNVLFATEYFRRNKLTLEGFKSCLRYKNYGNQYTLKSNKACNQVFIQDSIPIVKAYLGENTECKSLGRLVKEKIEEYKGIGFYYKGILRKWRV